MALNFLCAYNIIRQWITILSIYLDDFTAAERFLNAWYFDEENQLNFRFNIIWIKKFMQHNNCQHNLTLISTVVNTLYGIPTATCTLWAVHALLSLIWAKSYTCITT